MNFIETSKCMFVVKHYETWSELIIDVNYYKLKLGVNIFKLSEITESQCKEIVGSEDCVSYFLFTTDWYKCKLKDLLKSQGIQITDKTYIIKV